NTFFHIFLKKLSDFISSLKPPNPPTAFIQSIPTPQSTTHKPFIPTNIPYTTNKHHPHSKTTNHTITSFKLPHKIPHF
ncbi:hypothetical protein, partial [Bacillus altitudinis]|uniref:hypothetical protein n=1 Tax=Bacillus altitudinis TaxID=293387 RepID=UPI001C92DBD7